MNKTAPAAFAIFVLSGIAAAQDAVPTEPAFSDTLPAQRVATDDRKPLTA